MMMMSNQEELEKEGGHVLNFKGSLRAEELFLVIGLPVQGFCTWTASRRTQFPLEVSFEVATK